MLDLKKLLTKILQSLAVTTPTVTVTATTGTVKEVTAKRNGHVLSLTLKVYNTSSVAAGSYEFEGTIDQTEYRPLTYVSTTSFWGNRSLVTTINTTGAILMRNVSSYAMQSSSSDYVTVGVTYIVGG